MSPQHNTHQPDVCVHVRLLHVDSNPNARGKQKYITAHYITSQINPL